MSDTTEDAQDPKPEIEQAELVDEGGVGEPATSPGEKIEQPAKVMRVGAMMRQLLEQVREIDLDEPSRERMRDIYEQSITELSSALSPELHDELLRLSLPFSDAATPSEPELAVAKAQLVVVGSKALCRASRPPCSPNRSPRSNSWRRFVVDCQRDHRLRADSRQNGLVSTSSPACVTAATPEVSWREQFARALPRDDVCMAITAATRTSRIKELAIGVVALAASIGIGVAAAGGLSGPGVAQAIESPTAESATTLACPDGATGFPTAVDPTCTVVATNVLVDAVEVD